MALDIEAIVVSDEIAVVVDTATIPGSRGAAGATGAPGTFQALGVDGHASGSLTTTQVSSTIIDNVGQSVACDLVLPACAAGLAFVMQASEAGVNLWRIGAAASDKLYLNGVAGANNGYIGIVPTVGAYLSVWSFKSGVGKYDWMAVVGMGNWVIS